MPAVNLTLALSVLRALVTSPEHLTFCSHRIPDNLKTPKTDGISLMAKLNPG